MFIGRGRLGSAEDDTHRDGDESRDHQQLGNYLCTAFAVDAMDQAIIEQETDLNAAQRWAFIFRRRPRLFGP